MKKMKNIKKSWLALVLVGVVALFGYTLVRTAMVSPEVAQVTTGGVDGCISNVTSISFSGECSSGRFQKAIYKCANGSTAEKLAGVQCLDYQEVVKEAQNNCGMVCTTATSRPTTPPSPSTPTTPYPSPSVMSTAVPTSVPLPSPVASSANASCRVQVYKLKATDRVISDPLQYATSDRLIDLATHRAVPGERYAYIAESITDVPMTASMSASTKNFHGSQEPIKILTTSYGCRGYEKNMSCWYTPNSIESSRKVGMIVETDNSLNNLKYSSIQFTMYRVDYSRPTLCTATLQAKTIDKPSPKPAPTTPPRCVRMFGRTMCWPTARR